MTKKQARNARNRRNKERLWSDMAHTSPRSSNMLIAFGGGDSMTVFDKDGRRDYEGVSFEVAAAIILDRAASAKGFDL